jgi:hypothetical protein
MRTRKQAIALCLGLVSGSLAADSGSQFTSRVFFLINEPSPYQVQRSRKVIEREFADSIGSSPELHGFRYQVQAEGNQLVFSMITASKLQAPVQKAVSEIVGRLNGIVETKGRYDLTRIPLNATDQDNYLEVILDDTGTRIRSIVAKAIALRDLLSELKTQFGEESVDLLYPRGATKEVLPRFSYLISGECAAKQLDWSFKALQPKTLDETVRELAKLFNLAVESHQGTYIFTGECQGLAKLGLPSQTAFLPTRWVPLGELPGPRSYPLPVRVGTP